MGMLIVSTPEVIMRIQIKHVECLAYSLAKNRNVVIILLIYSNSDVINQIPQKAVMYSL